MQLFIRSFATLLFFSLLLTACSPAEEAKSITSESSADTIAEPKDAIRGLTYEGFKALTPLDSTQQTYWPKLWRMWQKEEWSDLEQFINTATKDTLNGGYPPASGFVNVEVVTLKVNTKLDRYGSVYGKFVSPQGTPFGARALPASSKSSKYYQFKVIKDIPNVNVGKAIPWFGEPGMGTQYQFQNSIQTLISNKYLIITDSVIPTSH